MFEGALKNKMNFSPDDKSLGELTFGVLDLSEPSQKKPAEVPKTKENPENFDSHAEETQQFPDTPANKTPPPKSPPSFSLETNFEPLEQKKRETKKESSVDISELKPVAVIKEITNNFDFDIKLEHSKSTNHSNNFKLDPEENNNNFKNSSEQFDFSAQNGTSTNNKVAPLEIGFSGDFAIQNIDSNHFESENSAPNSNSDEPLPAMHHTEKDRFLADVFELAQQTSTDVAPSFESPQGVTSTEMPDLGTFDPLPEEHHAHDFELGQPLLSDHLTENQADKTEMMDTNTEVHQNENENELEQISHLENLNISAQPSGHAPPAEAPISLETITEIGVPTNTQHIKSPKGVKNFLTSQTFFSAETSLKTSASKKIIIFGILILASAASAFVILFGDQFPIGQYIVLTKAKQIMTQFTGNNSKGDEPTENNKTNPGLAAKTTKNQNNKTKTAASKSNIKKQIENKQTESTSLFSKLTAKNRPNLSKSTQNSNHQDKKQADNVTNKGKNLKIFDIIEDALQTGDPIRALNGFKTPLAEALKTPEEKLLGAEYKARYQLMVSNADKAKRILHQQCSSLTFDNATTCVHYIRALLSIHKTNEAFPFINTLFTLLESESENAQLESIAELLKLTQNSFSSPNFLNVKILFENVIADQNFSAEWNRQRSVWIAHCLVLLNESDKILLANYLFVENREKLLSTLKTEQNHWARGQEPLLIPLLDWFAISNEQIPLKVQTFPSKLDTDLASASILSGSLSRIINPAIGNPISHAAVISGRPMYGELLKLMTLNIAIQESDSNSAGQIITNRPLFSGKFKYEWIMAGVRFAIQSNIMESLKGAKLALEDMAKVEPECVKDFQYWVTYARLLRTLNLNNETQLSKAKPLAIAPRDQGLLAVEEAYAMRNSGQMAKGLQHLKFAVGKIPHHSSLLEAAAEFAGLLREDPSPYIEAQSNIPAHHSVRRQDFPGLSNPTLKKVFLEL